jgi:hypothetical protein
MANGPGEELNTAAYDWQWNDPADPNGAWVAARIQCAKTPIPRQPAPGWWESR